MSNIPYDLEVGERVKYYSYIGTVVEIKNKNEVVIEYDDGKTYTNYIDCLERLDDNN